MEAYPEAMIQIGGEHRMTSIHVAAFVGDAEKLQAVCSDYLKRYFMF